jgi:hypothetical protein
MYYFLYSGRNCSVLQTFLLRGVLSDGSEMIMAEQVAGDLDEHFVQTATAVSKVILVFILEDVLNQVLMNI